MPTTAIDAGHHDRMLLRTPLAPEGSAADADRGVAERTRQPARHPVARRATRRVARSRHSWAPPASPRVPPLGPTLGDAVAQLAPGWRWSDLVGWPPDVFAATSALLVDSGAYRMVVSPAPDKRWPPGAVLGQGQNWTEAVRGWAAAWTRWATESSTPTVAPEPIRRLGAVAEASSGLPLSRLDDKRHWDTLVALLSLHAIADQACAGLGLSRPVSAFQHSASRLLRSTGSLSRLPVGRARVLPKVALPEGGMTIRSLSRHLAVDRSEVEARWHVADAVAGGPTDRLTVLLVPYPTTIDRQDFRPVAGPLDNMDPNQFGFFEFAPHQPFDPDRVVALVESARGTIGQVDVVVLPESVVEPEQAELLRQKLRGVGVAYLIAGVRERAARSGQLGANYAYLGEVSKEHGWRTQQHKHHRWQLEEHQLRRYDLDGQLAPSRRWWEAIGLRRRRLTFLTVAEGVTLCPLVCEDLARADAVAELIRSVGPSLVIALLLDGPQLASRWPGRSARVLADDPGCAVLTLTSVGMAGRSQPDDGMPSRDDGIPSRVVALWSDPTARLGADRARGLGGGRGAQRGAEAHPGDNG